MKRFKELITDQKFIFWFIVVGLSVPNVLMFFTESTSLMTRIVQLILPPAFYWFMMTLTRKPGKMFWWLFIFAFYDAFQIVLLKLYGETPLAVDMLLNVTTTNVTEVNELLSNLLAAVAFAVILYMTCIVLSIVSLRSKQVLDSVFRKAQRKLAGMALGVAIAALGANYFVSDGFKAQNDIFPINATYNTFLAVDRFYRTANYSKTSANFSYRATSCVDDTTSLIAVVVIGETARADDFGIYGYSRPTTPRLAALGDELVVYRDVMTMSNTTHKSVPLLMTDVACAAWDSIYTRKGMISAFKDAGFKTAYFSNQRRNHAFIDFFGEEADEVVFTKDSVPITANVLDSELKRLVEERLKKYDGGKLLIVVHCYGSHFNYRDRYPAGQAVFKPDNVISADKNQRDKLINAYDNTIHFADQLLGDIIQLLDSQDVASVLAFTSDHGEDIYDDSRDRFLHASPLPTYYQLRVPLLFHASSQYRDLFSDKWQNIASHHDIPVTSNIVFFHTMLDLAGIQSPYLKHGLALSDKSFKPSQRLYVNDHNEYLPLDKAGLKQLDIDRFNHNKLQFP